MSANTKYGLLALFVASAIPMGIFFAIEYYARGIDGAIRLVAAFTLVGLSGALILLAFLLALRLLDLIIIQLARAKGRQW